MLEISCNVHTDDFQMFERAINQGIDSRLEGFIFSEFYWENDRYFFNFHIDEVPLLIRRLTELADDRESEEYNGILDWVYDIIFEIYGVTIY